MNYTVHNLLLHRDITVPAEGIAKDGTVAILAYRSLVEKGNLEPEGACHLARCETTGDGDILPAGRYLFTQGLSAGGEDVISGKNREEAERDWRDAAEAVWLESLWQKMEFKTDRIFVRILSEDSKTVFQIFREVVKEE